MVHDADTMKAETVVKHHLVKRVLLVGCTRCRRASMHWAARSRSGELQTEDALDLVEATVARAAQPSLRPLTVLWTPADRLAGGMYLPVEQLADAGGAERDA